ncbi:MAG: carbohydrate ABC transporter permease [Egibacteraceae bacterium]
MSAIVAGRRTRLRRAGFYLVVTLVMVPFLAVFAYMLSTSFKPALAITSGDFRWLFAPTLDNYRAVFAENPFARYAVNSMIVALGSTTIGLVIGLPAAFVIARYRAPKLALTILSARVTPGITFLIPWFILFSQLRMIDTYQALIYTHLLQNLPLMIFLMISFFEEIPDELIESARVDGATVQRAFWSVVLPLARGGIAAAAILGFIFSWNHFMFSVVLAGNSTRTLPVAVFNFMSYGSVNWGAITAAATVMTLPVILLALTVQRHIIRGLAIGAVKG